jgi:sphingomyelin phosphodiesterase 2
MPGCSGAIGSGLAILSAYPILDSFVFPYTLSGYPLHFIEGDWFAAKAACGITIDVPRIGKVDVLNSHMYAPGGEGEGLDGAHRVAQAWELARLVNEKAERGRHVVVVRISRLV